MGGWVGAPHKKSETSEAKFKPLKSSLKKLFAHSVFQDFESAGLPSNRTDSFLAVNCSIYSVLFTLQLQGGQTLLILRTKIFQYKVENSKKYRKHSGRGPEGARGEARLSSIF